MGCGSSINPKIGLPSKKDSHIKVFPFTNLIQINHNLNFKEIALLSGEQENSLKYLKNAHVVKNNVLVVSLQKLENFKIKAKNFFPLVNFSIQDVDKKIIHSIKDYENFSKKGLLEDQEIKLVISTSNLVNNCIYELLINIKDKLDESSNYLDFYFTFKVNEEANLIEKDIISETKKFQDLTCSIREKLQITNIELETHEILSPPYKVSYGSKLFIKCFGLKGFEKKENFVNIGCSVSIFNENGSSIFYKEDMFPPDNEYHEEDLSELKFYVNIGGDYFKPNKFFYFSVIIWDKFGSGSLCVQGKYLTEEKIAFKGKVYEILNENNEKTVRLRAENGFAEGKLVFVKLSKNFLEIFEKNLEKTVEVGCIYEENNPKMNENILNISADGIEKKQVFWKLISVTAL